MEEIADLACITGDDDLLLLSTCREDREKGPYLRVEDFTEDQFISYFRFKREDIHRLCLALQIPSHFICPNGTRTSGTEGLFILLRRLAYPNRLDDMVPLFGRSKSEISYIVNKVLNFIFEKHAYKLRELDQNLLSEMKLREYAEAISDIGSPLSQCWGFIDGTVRPICRPLKHQKVVYSGHKRVHGLKFQSITIPNGLIIHMYGPVEAKRHDAAMLRMSGLMPMLEENMTLPDGTIFSLYGDPAYPLRPHLMSPFRGAVLTQQQMVFNKRMSKLRSSVEWSFGKILSLFSFVDYRKNQKLFLQPVAKYYLVAALLTNCHTCLYGSVTSDYFSLQPPTLEEYLS